MRRDGERQSRGHSRSREIGAILKSSAGISLYIFVFFLCFQSVKVQSLPGRRWLGVVAGLLLVLFAVMASVQLLLRRTLFRKASQNTQFVQEVATFVLPLAALGPCVFLYFYWLDLVQLNPAAFLRVQARVMLVGIMPVVALVLYGRNTVAAVGTNLSHQGSANSSSHLIAASNQHDSTIRVASRTGRDILEMELRDLLVITSAGNYVFVYSCKNGEVKKDLLRASLSQVEQMLGRHPEIFRCHRTAIVNLTKIKSASGDAQGYLLSFDHTDKTVPVSRNRVKAFLTLFRQVTGP